MFIYPRRALHWVYLGLVGLLCLTLLAPTIALASTDLEIGGSAVVANANGVEIDLRAGPGSAESSILTLAEGAEVTVLDGPITAEDGTIWYSVSIDDQSGYILSDYLELAGDAPAAAVEPEAEIPASEPEAPTEELPAAAEDPVATEDPVVAAPPAPAIGTAVIAGTNADGARCRVSADINGAVITIVPEGSVVELTGDPIGEWRPVNCADQAGFIHVDFISLDTGSDVDAPPEDDKTDDVPPSDDTGDGDVPPPDDGGGDDGAPPTDTPDDGGSAVTGSATVSGTNGGGVRCRADASFDSGIITVLAEGTTVSLRGPASGEWQPVVCNDGDGFINVAYLTIAEPSGDDAPPDDGASGDEGRETGGDNVVAGSATVSGTNGTGVRCRSGGSLDADIITVLAEGTSLSLRGAASGEWQPVVCNATNGFVHIDFLTITDPGTGEAEVPAEADTLVTAAALGNGIVSGTNGTGVRCRSGANMSASIITVLAEGVSVALRGGASGDWQPVTCNGSNGFVYSDYLTITAPGGNDEPSNGGSTALPGQGTVSGTNGDGVRCRSGASLNADIITIVGEGTSVTYRGAASGVWQPVTCSGTNGFIHSDYLTAAPATNPGGNNGNGNNSGNNAGNNTGYDAGDQVRVTGTGGGLRFRSGPSTSASIIMILSDGTLLSVIAGSTGDWVAVSSGGRSGFVHKDYVAPADTTGGNNGGNNNGGGSTDELSAGDHAATTSSLNLRSSASYSAGVAAVAPTGTVVEITGAGANGFYAVNWDGLTGYMHGDYLTWTNAPLSERGGTGNPGGGNPGGGSGSGNAIVDFAMGYLGYPYVWAGAGPNSFDCSGFTMYVIRNVLGLNITHDMFIQYDMGTPVSWGNWQPGDLVFFQNTFQWGLSHVGIYIGGGQFIHAENPSTGVRISDIGSTYYSTRYYGAVRF